MLLRHALPISLLLALVSACVPAPKKAYTADEARTLEDLSELMRINAKTMDPLFSLEDADTFTEAQFDQMGEAAALAEATSDAVKKKHALTRSPAFGSYADIMNSKAKELAAASEAREAEAAGAAIRGIHEACRSCHSEFR
jgi:cytochrome c556